MATVERERQTGRQTDMQTETDKTDGQTDRHRQTDLQTDRQIETAGTDPKALVHVNTMTVKTTDETKQRGY